MNVLEKIIEEIEEIYIDDVGFGVDCNLQGKSDLACDNCYECMKDVCKNIIRKYMDDATDTNDDWIPVEDGLPEEGQEVLAQFEVSLRSMKKGLIKEIYIHVLFWENGYWNSFAGMPNGKVVAWQPLPKPYKPKKL